MSEIIIKKLPKRKDDEERKRRKWIYTILILIILYLIFVGVIFIPAIINTTKEPPKYVSNYTVNMISDTTSLDTDKSLSLTNHNDSLNIDEKLRFSSTNSNVGVGPYLTKPYIFEDVAGSNSNVKLEFIITSKTIKSLLMEIYISDSDGNNITKLNDSDITKNSDLSITYSSNNDIYINKVVVTYTVS
jgi:cytoskeletal protein RodZ